MTDSYERPGAAEHNVLEQLGFGIPSAPSSPPALPIEAPAASTRRQARELERRPSSSPGRRIRKVQKSYAKPKGRTGARAIVPSGSSRPTTAPTKTVSAIKRSAVTRSRARTIGSRVLSIAAMVFAGALAVGMSVPANAFNNGSGAQVLAGATSTADKGQGQSLDVASTVSTSTAARDAYTVTSWAEMLRLQYGTRDYSYDMGDPNGPIRWPFPYPVPISSGFGERAAPCRACSSVHMGVDFTPGVGTPIYAAADGVVAVHDDDMGGFGNHVIIDHGNLLGDGNNIQTLYAHMQHGSVALVAGDAIKVGDFIGTVGMTGTATGNHLHFEVHVNGVQVDPFAWLQSHT